jgi:tetratricopeptide (TPR) repeat protein
MQEPGQAHWPKLLAAAVALACLVSAVFFPIVDFEFVDYDVRAQVVDNPYIRALSVENLKHIFTSRCATSYYPIRTLTFATDYQLWGLKASGFKLTNGLIHLTNVLLVFWLILRLFRHAASTNGSHSWWDFSVATFSAGVFAVHPLVVEPVAWVAGREELLMTLGALGCIHFHLSGRRQAEAGGKTSTVIAFHAGAALCCVAACLSNAVAAVIPLLITAWDVLMLARPKLRRIFYGTFALWAIGVATVVIKKLGSEGDFVAQQVGMFSTERLALVLNVFWLNLKTLVWPTQLAIEYADARPQSFPDTGIILGVIAVGLLCAVLWTLRRQKLALFGLVWFGLALGPTSQIMPHHIHRADRFLYLPLVGLAILIAIGLRPLVTVLKGRVTPVVIAALGLLSLLSILSAGQVRTWQSSASMWENCLRVDPNNALAHGGMADNLAAAGQFDKAIEHYRAAVLINPDNPDTLKNFAVLLATCHRKELRDYKLAMRLAERACKLTNHSDLAAVMAVAEIHAQAGRSEMAVAATEKAITLAEDAGDEKMAGELRSRLKLFQNRDPSEDVRQ